jgi:hypothetical protein
LKGNADLKARLTRRSGKRREVGAALLIAIFALLLISVVAIALVLSAGTDSALAGNYRMGTGAYYAGTAGLEEARGRLLYKNPNYIGTAYPALFPGQSATQFGLNDVVYIVNPPSGVTVDPTNSASPYYDNEYQNEFSIPITSATVHTPYITSVSSIQGFPGPNFAWVRINAVTEKALGIDVDGLHANDGITLLYYNGTSLIRPLAPPAGMPQALEITALAVMPDHSTKLVQYVVAPNSLQNVLPLPQSGPPAPSAFPAALTLAGNGVTYNGPDGSGFEVDGIDPTTGRTCANPALAPVAAVGFTNPADRAVVISGIPVSPVNDTGNYQGAPPPSGPPTPSVETVTLPPSLQKPSQIESLIQTLTQGADVVLTPTAPATSVTGSSLPTGPSGMSPTNTMTVVVNGDLDLTSWHNTGYGLLLVTGNLIYDPDASWSGVVLVMGKGTITGSRMGIGQFNGAMLVAQSRNPGTGAVLTDPNLGTSSVTFASSMGGKGIYFNSCAIVQALTPTTLKKLSFREISQ